MTAASVQLDEWSTVGPLESLSFGKDDKARATAESLSRAGILHVTELAEGLSVSATSYVGSLQLGPLHVSIQPKIEGAPLLTLVRYAYGLRDLRLFEEHRGRLEESSFQDLLLYQLAAEVNELVKRGLHRQYRRREESLASPRGRFDFGRVAKSAGVREATLPCRHHVRSEDCLPNQVLLAGLRHGVRLTADLRLRTTLRRTATLLDEQVAPVELSREVFGRVTREADRLVWAYQPTFRIVELIVGGQGVATRGARSPADFPGFLFDMNRFFQQVLSRFLHENLPGWDVRDEFRLKGLFAYLPDGNPANRKAPVPRPDFVVLRGLSVCAVLDAKYRDLWLNSIPRDMLYQLAIYALSQKHLREAVILYPTMSAHASEARMEVRDPVDGSQKAVVALRPVLIDRVVEAVSAGHGPAAVRDRQRFAAQLAFGR